MAREDLMRIIGLAVTKEGFVDELCKQLGQRSDHTRRASIATYLRSHAGGLDERELEYLLSNRDVDICQCLRILKMCLAIEYDEASAQKRQ